MSEPIKTGNNGKFKAGNPGRPVGAKNHLTKTVKETVLAVFNELQDDPNHNLIAFATKHPRDFYAIAAKLIPTDIKADVRLTKVTLEIVRDKTIMPVHATSPSAESN